MEKTKTSNNQYKYNRKKGSSLVEFINDYTVIDIETTGLSPFYDSIIEIAAIKVRDGKPISSFSQTVKENENVKICKFIEQLTGINQETIDKSSSLDEVLPSFLEYIGNDVLLGHNIHFDLNFLYDRAVSILNHIINNDFIDTLKLANKLFPDLPSKRLEYLSTEFNIDYANAHRAEKDCLITHSLYIRLKEEAIFKYKTESSFIESFKPKYLKYNLSDLRKTSDKYINKNSLLYKKEVVFTGKLESMNRKDAMQMVLNIGGTVKDSITKTTNILVVGDFNYCSFIRDNKSNKLKKAEKYILEGQDLIIIPEREFCKILCDYET